MSLKEKIIQRYQKEKELFQKRKEEFREEWKKIKEEADEKSKQYDEKIEEKIKPYRERWKKYKREHNLDKTFLDWETIEDNDWALTERLMVKGGWMIRSRMKSVEAHADGIGVGVGVGLSFYPDKNHEWDPDIVSDSEPDLD